MSDISDNIISLLSEKKLHEARNLIQIELQKNYDLDLIAMLADSYWQERNYNKAISLINEANLDSELNKPHFIRTFILYNLIQCKLDEVLEFNNKLISNSSILNTELLSVHSTNTLIHFLHNNTPALSESMKLSNPILKNLIVRLMPENSVPGMLRTYINYINRILNFRSEKPSYYNNSSNREVYIIGDSHSISSAFVTHNDIKFVPKLIFGTKAWHLNQSLNHPSVQSLKNAIQEIPSSAVALFNFGEIDCRANEHIFTLAKQGVNLNQLLSATILPYIDTVTKLSKDLDFKICNVPAPSKEAINKLIKQRSMTQEEIPLYIEMIRKFNSTIHETINSENIIDLYKATKDSDGLAIPGVHIDYVHLKPDIVPNILA